MADHDNRHDEYVVAHNPRNLRHAPEGNPHRPELGLVTQAGHGLHKSQGTQHLQTPQRRAYGDVQGLQHPGSKCTADDDENEIAEIHWVANKMIPKSVGERLHYNLPQEGNDAQGIQQIKHRNRAGIASLGIQISPDPNGQAIEEYQGTHRRLVAGRINHVHQVDIFLRLLHALLLFCSLVLVEGVHPLPQVWSLDRHRILFVIGVLLLNGSQHFVF
mmetsp:Transcript_40476/g.85546  ORF Transcript_40476/g.85546 Transcript_40476/m.85546 type:complete len:217 (-) Transcript_40476:567-1217(-)